MASAGLKGAAVGGASVLLLGGAGFWLLGNTMSHGPKAATASVQVQPALRSGADNTLAAVAAPPATVPPPAAATPVAAPAEVPADVLFASHSPAVLRVIARGSDFTGIFGSGFFVSSDGLLVTNYHVIKGAEYISVVRDDNTTLFVEGIASEDKNADLALLKVNVKDVPFLPLGPDAAPKIGTKVYAIGNPVGLTNTLSDGLISGLRNDGDRLVAIQTSAAISHGSSGGPLLTCDGVVVGVTAASMVNGQNLNFAVPAAQVRQLIANQGELRKLATAGAPPLDPSQTEEFAAVWSALDRRQYATASRLLATMRYEHENDALYWLATGFLHNQLNNTALAIDAYKKALHIDSKIESGWFGLGMTYLKSEQNTAAIEAFKSAAKAKPRNTRAYVGAGMACSAMGDYNKALEFFRKASEFSPNDPGPYAHMGVAYLNQKHVADAIAVLNKAISLKPDYAYSYVPLGLAYMETGRLQEAKAAWHNAILFDPFGPSGQAAREELKLFKME